MFFASVKSRFFLLLILFSVCCCGAEKSPYQNDEEHFAEKLDPNGVPIDPECKFKTYWTNVRLSGITRAGIPNGVIAKMTIVSFHYAGAWIAWTDKNGYHEPTHAEYIQWRNFPEAIRKYYAAYCVPRFKKDVKVRKKFSLRTPQFTRSGKPIQKRYGNYIKRRAPSGLLVPEVFKNVYVPYSEFPPEVRKLVGFWQNEAYMKDMPVLERVPGSLDDELLFIEAKGFYPSRRYKDGALAKVLFFNGKRLVQREIFINHGKHRLRPNHYSDLHAFVENSRHKVCSKCELSDHTHSDRYFNFMFDRQARAACPRKHLEYALVKNGSKTIGRRTYISYDYMPDFDKKYPPDSRRLMNEAVAVSEELNGDNSEDAPLEE